MSPPGRCSHRGSPAGAGSAKLTAAAGNAGGTPSPELHLKRGKHGHGETNKQPLHSNTGLVKSVFSGCLHISLEYTGLFKGN